MKNQKYFSPDWTLTVEASARAIERGYGAAMKIGDQVYIEIDYHNPINSIVEKHMEFPAILPLDYSFVYFLKNYASCPHRATKLANYHHRLFFAIIENSLSEDTYGGYFYILRCQEYYKIGITQDYASRKKVYRTENPFKLEEIFVEKIYCADKVEGFLKKALAHKNHRGEWFLLSNRDVKFIRYALTNIAV